MKGRGKGGEINSVLAEKFKQTHFKEIAVRQ